MQMETTLSQIQQYLSILLRRAQNLFTIELIVHSIADSPLFVRQKKHTHILHVCFATHSSFCIYILWSILWISVSRYVPVDMPSGLGHMLTRVKRMKSSACNSTSCIRKTAWSHVDVYRERKRLSVCVCVCVLISSSLFISLKLIE